MERAIIDAHVFLWALYAPEKLSRPVSRIFTSSATRLEISAATIWEILVKQQAGKLDTTQREIEDGLDGLQMRVLMVRTEHLWALQHVGVPEHRDPFDRLLIATAIYEQVPIVTADRSFRLHGNVKTVW